MIVIIVQIGMLRKAAEMWQVPARGDLILFEDGIKELAVKEVLWGMVNQRAPGVPVVTLEDPPDLVELVPILLERGWFAPPAPESEEKNPW